MLRMIALFLAVALAAAQPAAAENPLSEAQQQAVRDLILQTLRENPGIVMEAAELYRQQQAEHERMAAAAAIEQNLAALTDDPGDPSFGNPKGDITIVEFFDYNCGYCKRVFPTVMELIGRDGNIRYVAKEYPILGESSVTAARAALAVWNAWPEKYSDFHAALMEMRGIAEEKIFALASEQGMEVEKLKAAMDDPKVDARLRANITLGQTVGVTGTPAFIIGTEFYPGAIPAETFVEAIKRQRKG